MKFGMGSGIMKYIRASKIFSKFRALRRSVRIPKYIRLQN